MMRKGIPVSPGVVVARAYCLDEAFGRKKAAQSLEPTDSTVELDRFNRACDAAAEELRALIEKVSEEIGERESAIFQAHLFILRDRALVNKVKNFIIDEQLDAANALREALAEYEGLFAKIDDEYLRERIVDMRDVVGRVQAHLHERPANVEHVVSGERVVLVAKEVFPSQTVGFKSLNISGIVTERGGGTSHAAIIARSMGIPAVSGIADLLEIVKPGDLVVLDGREGRLVVNPGPEAEAAYRKLEREFFDFKDYLIENRDQPAITLDGHEIELLANINNVSDAKAAVEVGAKGVGLFRTEYIFLTHPSVPGEEEQLDTYREVLRASPNQRLTIRTLDLGGDKTVPYLGDHRETNPFMGWRSIRLSFEHPEFFRKQIRAILRAGTEGKVRMMFPMITTLEELRRANRIVGQVRAQLERDGIPYGKNVELGIMLEIPAAAVCIENLIEHAHFISIGTNDLIQYLMAADRDNPKVAHLCDPLNPAVLRLLYRVIGACREKNVPVTVCGEMAGRPRCVLALLAFGLRSLSMSPALVPIIKELVHGIKLSDLQEVGDDILRRRSGQNIRRYLSGLLNKVNPRLAMLEFK